MTYRTLLAVLFGMMCALARASALGPDGEVGQYHPGKFVWFDLATDNLGAARAFYGAVFDWKFRTVAKGAASYTLIEHDGGKVAGMFQRERPRGAAVGARWLALMSVPDVAKAARYVEQNGGQVLVPPRQIAGRGTDAVFRDPQGAPFGVLAAEGGDPSDEPVTEGDVFWLDLFEADAQRAAKFYSGLAGYRVIETQTQAGHTRLLLATGDIARAGIVNAPSDKIGAGWMPYFLVDDLDATLERVKRAGGKVVVAPRADVVDGKLAVVADPGGGVFGVIDWPIRAERANAK